VRLLNRERSQKLSKPRMTSSSEEVQSKFRCLVRSKKFDAAINRAAGFRLHDPEAA